MRGDISIVDGKLCYEFDMSDTTNVTKGNVINKHNGKFYDEWVIHKVDKSQKKFWAWKHEQDVYGPIFDQYDDLLDELNKSIDRTWRENMRLKTEIKELRMKINGNPDVMDIIEMHEEMYHTPLLTRIKRFFKRLYYNHIKYRNVPKIKVIDIWDK